MEDLQNFLSDNNELSTYYRLKKEFPLFDDAIINAMAFPDLRNENYYEQVKKEEQVKNEILKEQIENNKNKVIENGLEALTPVEDIINKINFNDAVRNKEIDELLERLSKLE